MCLEDLAKGLTLQLAHSDLTAADSLIRERQPQTFSFADCSGWMRWK